MRKTLIALLIFAACSAFAGEDGTLSLSPAAVMLPCSAMAAINRRCRISTAL